MYVDGGVYDLFGYLVYEHVFLPFVVESIYWFGAGFQIGRLIFVFEFFLMLGLWSFFSR